MPEAALDPLEEGTDEEGNHPKEYCQKEGSGKIGRRIGRENPDQDGRVGA
jgi:hypothetical protein